MLRILISSLLAIAHAQNINCPSSHSESSQFIDRSDDYEDAYFDFYRNENDGKCASSPLNTKNAAACATMITYDTIEEFNNAPYAFPAFHYGAFTNLCIHRNFNEGCFAYENNESTVAQFQINQIYTGDGSLSDNNITIVCCCETDMCTQKLDCANIAELAEAIIDSKTDGIPYEDWDKYQCAMCDAKLVESNDEWSKTSKLLIMILVPIGFVMIGLVGYCLGKGKISTSGYNRASSEIEL